MEIPQALEEATSFGDLLVEECRKVADERNLLQEFDLFGGYIEVEGRPFNPVNMMFAVYAMEKENRYSPRRANFFVREDKDIPGQSIFALTIREIALLAVGCLDGYIARIDHEAEKAITS